MCIPSDNNEQNNTLSRLIALAHYDGEYPSIFKQVEQEIRDHFNNFLIKSIAIASLASDKCVPQTDMEFRLFWNKNNCFEFYYKVLIGEDQQEEKLKQLQGLCRSKTRFHLCLLPNVLEETNNKTFDYVLIMCLYGMGRNNAFEQSDKFVKYLKEKGFTPLDIVHQFIVCGKNFQIDENKTIV
ncbi:unnamed protein product [Rotaria magnacalcarata]